MSENNTLAVLHAASAAAGLDSDGAAVIRIAENAIYRLPGGVVARIARSGQDAAAAKEVNVARWLEDSGISAARVLRSVDQPVLAEGRAVTFWHELPPHKNGTMADVANVLREFHRLAPPTCFRLPLLAPFVRLPERIDAAHTLIDDDRAWLRARLGDLTTAVRRTTARTSDCGARRCLGGQRRGHQRRASFAGF